MALGPSDHHRGPMNISSLHPTGRAQTNHITSCNSVMSDGMQGSLTGLQQLGTDPFPQKNQNGLAGSLTHLNQFVPNHSTQPMSQHTIISKTSNVQNQVHNG